THSPLVPAKAGTQSFGQRTGCPLSASAESFGGLRPNPSKPLAQAGRGHERSVGQPRFDHALRTGVCATIGAARPVCAESQGDLRMEQNLIETSSDAIATLMFTRPQRLNALSRTLLDGLLEALPRLAGDPSV